ncbi:MAG TPA: ATPase, T2SS/T4P/T4SS family [Acidimicrobiales bacterium]
MSRYGPLGSLLDDGEVSEIMINGPGAVWVERRGVLERTDVELDTRAIETIIERLLTPSGRRVDRRVPFADARLPDGSRVHVVIPPAAVDGPCVSIRRFVRSPRSLDAFASPEVVRLLEWLVMARANIVVTGAASAGKTTLLGALGRAIGQHERVITIEDAAELSLDAGHVVRLEARPPNSEGVGAVSLRALLRNALRMRPDRLVIGEVRGAEAVELLQAMSTGHDGSLATCHANGPLDALRRLEIMVLLGDHSLDATAVREQLVSAVDVVVHVARRRDGARVVAQVVEVCSETPVSVRTLADADRVVALPHRPPRAPSVPAPPVVPAVAKEPV